MPGFFLQQHALACLRILGNFYVQRLISAYPKFAQILGVILCWGGWSVILFIELLFHNCICLWLAL